MVLNYYYAVCSLNCPQHLSSLLKHPNPDYFLLVSPSCWLIYQYGLNERVWMRTLFGYTMETTSPAHYESVLVKSCMECVDWPANEICLICICWHFSQDHTVRMLCHPNMCYMWYESNKFSGIFKENWYCEFIQNKIIIHSLDKTSWIFGF